MALHRMITIDLAGIRVRLECQAIDLSEAVSLRYAPFRVADDLGADFVVSVEWRGERHNGQISAATLLSESVRLSGRRFEIDRPGVRATISMPDRRAGLVWEGGDPLSELEYFLRIICALLVEEFGGLFLHAAGVLGEGKAWLFTGRSGSGKTTVVSLLPELVALGDDLLIVKPSDAGWVAHGTPFWNAETLTRSGQTLGAPIGGIYRLVQARETYVESMSLAVASAELMANCPVLNGDPDRVPQLLSRCYLLAEAVPVRRLHFLKDRTFWPLVLSGQSLH